MRQAIRCSVAKLTASLAVRRRRLWVRCRRQRLIRRACRSGGPVGKAATSDATARLRDGLDLMRHHWPHIPEPDTAGSAAAVPFAVSQSCRNSTSPSISTGMPNGSSAMPTALLA